MKMKKLMAIAVSAALVVSMAAATAFAVESTPSKTGTDADTGRTDVTISGTGDVDGLLVDVEPTEASIAQEKLLKENGTQGYLGDQSAAAAAQSLNVAASQLTINEVKQLVVSGYSREMEDVTLKVPFAALPKAGTRVAVLIRIGENKETQNDVLVEGVVVEDLETVEGETSKVRKVQFKLDSATVVLAESTRTYVAVVTAK